MQIEVYHPANLARLQRQGTVKVDSAGGFLIRKPHADHGYNACSWYPVRAALLGEECWGYDPVRGGTPHYRGICEVAL
jgi:hypothetical protein